MKGRLHPLLLAYRCAAWLARPLMPRFLRRRQANGKEDGARLGERCGLAGLARPAGRLVWMHGASVGEALALLPLVALVQAQGFGVLVTTGTVTSAQVLAQRLPQGALHQYVPLDAAAYVRRFFDTWRPDLIVLAESELWPNLLLAAKAQHIPVALVNARMSARSFRRWGLAKGFAGALLGCVDVCLAQSQQDAGRLSHLGAGHVEVCGNLKYDAAALPADPAALGALRQSIGGRPCWVAASTHAGEEALCLDAHRALVARFPDLLTILAPRHPARAGAIAPLVAAAGLQLAQRSRGDEVTALTQVYLCDTMGELGLLYRLNAPVFLGKSLGGAGGQNPIEAALLGNAILHGPAVANFADIYRLLDEAGGARPVHDAGSLASALAALLVSPGARAAMAQRGAGAIAAQRGAADAVMRALAPWLAGRTPDLGA